jgi:hypothetical protein
MKTIALNLSSLTKTLLIALSFAFVLTSCDDDDKTPNPTDSSSEIVAIPFFVETAEGELPSQAADLLYEVRTKQPVLAPSGDQVTWAEFSAVQGMVEVECTDAGTRVYMELTNLIPEGVYTIWNVTVKAPGFDPAAEMFNITGIGAAGNGIGTDNTIIASSNGSGKIELTSAGGPLSMIGEIEACALTEYEWHVVGAYHIDGRTYGPDLGPDGTAVENFGFIFKSSN